MGKKLYVGNLGFDVTDQELESLFAQAGVCQSATVISDKFTGRSRGFGFVEMSSNDEAQKAIQQFDGQEFKGRALRVNEANEERRGGGGGGGGGRDSHGGRGGRGGGGGGGSRGWGR
jgi:RNA recognition motif-containing protein